MTVVWCQRRRRRAPVEEWELADMGGSPEFLPIVVPPPGWTPDPDDLTGGGIVCEPCSTRSEAAAWMSALAAADDLVRSLVEDVND